MNVKIKEEEGKRKVRRGLSVTKDFKAGEEVYRESPIVAVAEMEGTCRYCLREVPNDVEILCEKCEKDTYCCSSCRETAQKETHHLLCSADAQTGEAVRRLNEHCDEHNTQYPILTATFLAKMVYEELLTDKPKYSTFDHLERLHDLKPQVTDKDRDELKLIKEAVAPNVPGFGDFLTEERYMLIKGKMLYNAFAVASERKATTQFAQRARGSVSAEQRAGIALYHITSFIAHSCAPNVEVQFPDATRDMALIAQADLKAGDEIFVSYVSVNGLSTTERRKILKEAYSFHCKCTKCAVPRDA